MINYYRNYNRYGTPRRMQYLPSLVLHYEDEFVSLHRQVLTTTKQTGSSRNYKRGMSVRGLSVALPRLSVLRFSRPFSTPHATSPTSIALSSAIILLSAFSSLTSPYSFNPLKTFIWNSGLSAIVTRKTIYIIQTIHYIC